MEIKSIASSSKGNCYLVSDGITKILLECGITLDRIREHTNLDFNACLVTHEHMDHAKSLAKLLQNCKKVYATKGTLESVDSKFPFKSFKHFANIIEKNKLFRVGTFDVIPFETQHDAAESVGYFMKSNVNNETILFATDTYYIKNRFQNVNYLMIECNFSEDILKYNLQNNLINIKQSKRIFESHFELNNVKKFIKSLDTSKLKEVYLLHLSSGNSDEKLFKKEIQSLVGCPVWVCLE